MMRFFIAAYVVGLSLVLSSLQASDAAEQSAFKFDVISGVSTTELWHSTQQLILGDGVSIAYFRFDPEDADRDGPWIAQGVVMGGSADLGSKPVAIKLWSKTPVTLNNKSAAASAGKIDVTALFETRPHCSQKASCPHSSFKFSVMSDGRVLTDQRLIGKVQ